MSSLGTGVFFHPGRVDVNLLSVGPGQTRLEVNPSRAGGIKPQHDVRRHRVLRAFYQAFRGCQGEEAVIRARWGPLTALPCVSAADITTGHHVSIQQQHLIPHVQGCHTQSYSIYTITKPLNDGFHREMDHHTVSASRQTMSVEGMYIKGVHVLETVNPASVQMNRTWFAGSFRLVATDRVAMRHSAREAACFAVPPKLIRGTNKL